MTDASIRSNVLRLCPLLINIYEKNDLGSFILRFQDWKKQEALKCGILIKDLLDIEKQWTNVENIGLELHNRNLEQAIELIPESFMQVQMLFIRVCINKYNMIAFVDTGAQVSLLSKGAAERCNLMQLVDSRFKITAQGVGGAMEAIGKISKCEITIGGHTFLSTLNVLPNDNTGMDLIIGLDMLLKYKAVIDLRV